jgi:hypothetical protein
MLHVASHLDVIRISAEDSSGLGYCPVAGSCEHGNETSDSEKSGEFLYHSSDCQLLKRYSAP